MDTTRAGRRDEGFTLVELLVAMGIFSLLMVIVTTIFVQGLRGVTTLNADANVQQEQQNAALWISRLLRYVDNPWEGSAPPAAIDAASSSSITFYSFAAAGTSTYDRQPFKVTVKQSGNDVVSEVTNPVASGGTFTWPGTPATRTLVRATTRNKPTLALRYYNGQGTELLPPADAAAFPEWARGIESVRFTITDSGSAVIADQTVMIANPR